MRTHFPRPVSDLGLGPVEVGPRLEALRSLLGAVALPPEPSRALAPIEDALGEAVRLLTTPRPDASARARLERLVERLGANLAEPDADLGPELERAVRESLPYFPHPEFVEVSSRLLARLSGDRLPLESWSVVHLMGVIAREGWRRRLSELDWAPLQAPLHGLASRFRDPGLQEPNGAPLEVLRYARRLTPAEAREGLAALLEHLAQRRVPGPEAGPGAALAARNIFNL